jgi:glycosyltransferase involved in cell wall biosynthesis
MDLHTLAADNPNIHFMGGFARAELPAVLGNLDVTVVPSVWPEVAGLVVQEAFAAKIPVLASNMGGLPEFVGNHRGGLLFDVNGSQSLLGVLRRIVDGGHTFINQLRATIPPVRTTQDEFQFMENLYTELKADHAQQLN